MFRNHFRKVIVIQMFFLSYFSLNISAQLLFKTLDLRDNLSNRKYYIGFGVRANTFTGHTFVILGRENDDKQRTEIYLRGFYPKGEGKFFDKGQIIDDFENKNFISTYHNLNFIVNRDDFQKVKELIFDWDKNPRRYNFATNNCIDLVTNAIGRIGVKLPSSFVKTPLKFITNVISMLDSEGLEYKENSLIKTNFLTTEVYENKKDLNNSKVRTSNGSEILIGQRGDGKFDGVAKVENVKWGKALLLYDKGIIDFSKTEFLDNKFFELVKKENSVVELKVAEKIENYSNGSSRILKFDITKKNKVSGQFIHNGTTCAEIYFSNDSLFTTCQDKDGNTYEADHKIIVEDKQIKFIPSSDRVIIKTNAYTFKGSAHYKGKKIHQKGLVTFANGDTYQGELLNGLFNGKGTYTHVERPSRFLGIRFGNNLSYVKSGTWVNGTFEGLGNSVPGIDPRQAFETQVDFSVPLPAPIIQDNTKPKPLQEKPPADIPFEVKVTSVKTAKKITITVKNRIWDPIRKKWVLP